MIQRKKKCAVHVCTYVYTVHVVVYMCTTCACVNRAGNRRRGDRTLISFSLSYLLPPFVASTMITRLSAGSNGDPSVGV